VKRHERVRIALRADALAQVKLDWHALIVRVADDFVLAAAVEAFGALLVQEVEVALC
jgi:hypothetical protein